jgi:phage-related protein
LAKIFKDDLLPIIQAWWDFLVNIVIPGIVATVRPVVDGLISAFAGIAQKIRDNEENLKPLFDLFKAVASFVYKTLGPALGEILGAALKVVGKLVEGLITGFSALVGIIDSVVDSIKAIINLVKNNPIVQGIGGVISSVFGGGRASGGPVSSSKSYVVGEKGPELFVPNTNGMIVPNNALGSSGGTVINLTVNGALDAEGTARTIVNLLNRSNARGTLGANRLAFG